MTVNEDHLSVPVHVLPRLHHIEPGQSFTLKVPPRSYQLISKCSKYGYVKNGKIGLSAEIKPDGMIFGDGAGWRTRS